MCSVACTRSAGIVIQVCRLRRSLNACSSRSRLCVDWNSLFPTAAELVQYYRGFVEQYDLAKSTLFDQEVIKATWDADRALWVTQVKDITSGHVTQWTTKVLIQAAGTYNRKSIPPIPGISSFSGDTWHTLDWPEKYDFSGKTVAYVGTGPTSVQVLPHLQREASSVTVFCRSMTFCHPFADFNYPTSVKWAFRHVPGFLALYAGLVASLFGIWAWFAFRPSSPVAKFTEYYCRRVLHREVSNPVLRHKLEPTGRFGAKRPLVFLKGFFEVLQKENVKVVTDAIVAIDREGVVTRKAEGDTVGSETTLVKSDVLIWGTGFNMQGWGGALPTVGREGVLLNEHWADGPKTLYGM
jgi:cation diffusion facilitator CzcD-associated flavoprotein CzcO